VTTVLLLGKSGQVGHELMTALAPLGRLIAPDRATLDLENPDSIQSVISAVRPDVIVNAAGLTIVDDAEVNPELAMKVNGVAPGIIAEVAKNIGSFLVHYSTTFVFDGTKREPYTEDDIPNPINAYGRSKLAGERAIQACGGDHIILRANWTYSSRRTNFVLKILELARSSTEIKVVDDQVGAPTWARSYAGATATMVRNLPQLYANAGTYNLSATGQCTRFQWAQRILESAKDFTGVRNGWARLAPTTTMDYVNPAPRPLYTVTNNNKARERLGLLLESWDADTRDCLKCHFYNLPDEQRTSGLPGEVTS
jgi:dTDP-4-dehydrorhamnose reductase